MAGKPIRIAILANGKQARSEIGSTESALQRMGKMGKKIGAGIAVGGAVAGAALVKLSIDSVKAASDAQQSLGATKTVFGQYADTVIKRSKEAATALGLSANEYRELSNVTGAMLSGAGIPLKKVTSLTDKLNRRAADMAATFGGTTKEAVEAIGSLMRGEADPIERYGVSIKASDVSARLAAKGLDKLTGEAKKQAEMQERVTLLMDKSKTSAGAFSKESGTLANQQQKLNAQFTDLKASIGTAALPYLTKFATYLNGPGLKSAKDFGAGLKTAFKDGDQGKGPLAVTVTQLKIGWGAMKRIWAGIEDGWGRLKSILSDTSGDNAGMFLRLREGMEGLTDFIKGPGGSALQWLAKNAFVAIGHAIDGVVTAVKFLGNVFFDLVPIVNSVATTVLTTISGMGSGVLAGFLKMAEAADAIPGVDMSSTIENLKAGKGALDGFSADAKAAAKAMEKDFSERQWEWNLNADDLRVFENQLRLLPDEVETQIKIPGAVDSAAEVDALVTKFKLTPAEVTTMMRAEGTKTTLFHLANIQKQQKLTPKQMRLVMKAQGFEPTKKNIRELATLTGKTPKQVRTWFKAEGTKAAGAAIEGVGKKARDAGKTKGEAKVTANTKGALKSIEGAKKAARDYGKIAIPPPDFAGPTRRAVTPAKAAASSGGVGIGLNAAAGAAAGVNAGSGAFSGAMRNMVASGIAAGRAQAQIKSPSRVTKKDGRFIAHGYRAGIDGGKKGVAKAARGLMNATLKESTNGAKDIVSSVDSWLSKLGRGASGKKAQARLAKQRKQLLKATADETAKLAANGKQRNAVAEQLAAAKDKLNEAKQAFTDYKTAVADSIRSSASLAKVGEGDGFGSIEQLIAKRKALAAQAGEWKQVIAKLTASGLNKADLDELIQMGPEAGMGTAQAILGGGKSAVVELNKVQAQLDATANAMGQSTAKTMKQAGIDSAAGLVNGLAAKSKQLDAAAKALAKTLVKAIKKELGIKSPSRVFKALGKYTTDGLLIGLDDYRVAKAGKALATDLQSGFGAPALRAVDGTVGGRFSSAGQQPVQVIVQVPPTADLAAVGREIQRAIDAHVATGGRVRAA